MKVLEPKEPYKRGDKEPIYFVKYANGQELNAKTRSTIIANAIKEITIQDQHSFYPLIEELFSYLGFNCKATRAGDTNNRTDAFIIDDTNSLPIEIKSPTEVQFVNIKSIRQAIENKIILLSRKFYPSSFGTSSLSIGYTYPAARSEVYDLIEDVFNAYGFNIGIIDLKDILECVWDLQVNKIPFDKQRIVELKGKFR